MDNWHIWFAWYPVKVQGQWVWLQKIARSFDFLHPGY